MAAIFFWQTTSPSSILMFIDIHTYLNISFQRKKADWRILVRGKKMCAKITGSIAINALCNARKGTRTKERKKMCLLGGRESKQALLLLFSHWLTILPFWWKDDGTRKSVKKRGYIFSHLLHLPTVYLIRGIFPFENISMLGGKRLVHFLFFPANSGLMNKVVGSVCTHASLQTWIVGGQDCGSEAVEHLCFSRDLEHYSMLKRTWVKF